eukprot:COSAG01_NODE_1361_length_10566_cov_2.658674_7_plen_142_part_00
MFWAQTVAPGAPGSVCNDGQPAGNGCYHIQCITGNYSSLPQGGVKSMLSFGSGCPWTSTTCTVDHGIDARSIVCNFGGHGGFDKESALSADGTVIGPAPNYPNSGLCAAPPSPPPLKSPLIHDGIHVDWDFPASNLFLPRN